MTKLHNAREIRPVAGAAGFRFAVVVSRFNSFITDRLLSGALDALEAAGATAEEIEVVHVPGSFEIPLVAKKLAEAGLADAIIAGLRRRGGKLEVERLVAIATSEYPTKATRPKNSRLDHRRLNEAYGIAMPSWRAALASELDELTGVTVDEDGFGDAAPAADSDEGTVRLRKA